MRLTLGEMIYRFRLEKDKKSGVLCNGLCSTALLSQMEKGKQEPDVLLFIHFMERMGVSPEHFSLMITEEERDYIEWRNQIMYGILEKDWESLGKLLELDFATTICCNEKVEKQFSFYAQGIYEANHKKDFSAAGTLFEKALVLTIPDAEIVKKKKVLLSTLELSIFMLYLYYGVKGDILSQQEALKLFHILEEYVYSGVMDSDEQAKAYPKLICIGIMVLEGLTEEEQKRLLEKSIHMARKDKSFHDLTEVLQRYIPFLEKCKDEQLPFYRTQYRLFCDLLEGEGEDITFRPEMTALSCPNYYVISEYLESERKKQGMTQAEISEGICEPETYSRVEKGRRAPSRKNRKALVERLGISWNYYRGELDTCELKAYHLRMAHRLASIEGRYEDSLDLLHQLEDMLDMESVENYQYVKFEECVLRERLGLQRTEDAYKELEQLLSCTKILDKEYQGLVYYTQTELEIIGNMAQMLKKVGRSGEGIELIIPVLRQFKKAG